MTTGTDSDLYPLGEAPPLGEVPARMHAQLIRESRFGEPLQAFAPEVVDIPPVGPDDALVYVMAAGVNYNNVWAGRGVPIDVIAARQKAGEAEDFHIGGSDALRDRLCVGENVTNIKVGDEVIAHCGIWNGARARDHLGWRPHVRPLLPHLGLRDQLGAPSPSSRRSRPTSASPRPPTSPGKKPPAPTLVGATAYRMLCSWQPHTVRRGRCRPHLGRRRRPRHHGHPARRPPGRQAHRRRLQRRQGRVLQAARRGRLHQPQELRPLGPPPRLGGPVRHGQVRQGRPRLRQGHLGTCSASAAALASSSSTPARTPSPPPCSSAIPGGWLSSAPAPPLQRRYRPALPLDAAEALPGLPLRQRRAGGRVQRPRHPGQDRPPASPASSPSRRRAPATSSCSKTAHPDGNMAILVGATEEGQGRR